MTTKRLVIGIDPGLHGAVAVHDGERIVALEDIPVVQFSHARIKHRVDGALLAKLLEPYVADCRLAVVERVSARPGEAASSSFCFGYTSGCILGVLGALRVPVALPMPVTWKRAMKLGKDKNLSRARAIEMYPDIAGKLSRVKDHDRAESVLLAAYGIHHLPTHVDQYGVDAWKASMPSALQGLLTAVPGQPRTNPNTVRPQGSKNTLA